MRGDARRVIKLICIEILLAERHGVFDVPFDYLSRRGPGFKHLDADQSCAKQLKITALDWTKTQPDSEVNRYAQLMARYCKSKAKVAAGFFDDRGLPGYDISCGDGSLNDKSRRANLMTTARVIAFKLGEQARFDLAKRTQTVGLQFLSGCIG